MPDPLPPVRELLRRAYIEGFTAATAWRPPPTEAERGAEVWLRRNLEAVTAAVQPPPAPPEPPGRPLAQLTYQPAQAARILGISRSYLWKCIKAGKIPTFRWLDMTMIRAEDLTAARNEAWVKRPGGAGEAQPPWPPGQPDSKPTTPP